MNLREDHRQEMGQADDVPSTTGNAMRHRPRGVESEQDRDLVALYPPMSFVGSVRSRVAVAVAGAEGPTRRPCRRSRVRFTQA